VEDEKEPALHDPDDALAQAAEGGDGAAHGGRQRRVPCAEQRWRLEAHGVERPALDRPLEAFDIGGDLGKLRHA
jgi:hypothetical protein